MQKLFDRIPKEKQEAVLSAAMKEFTDKGYRAASTNAIVRRIGISKGILYKYFPTKEELFKAVVDFASGHVAEVVSSGLPRLPEEVTERIVELARLELELYRQVPHYYAFFRRVVQEDRDPVVQDVREEQNIASRRMFQHILGGARFPSGYNEKERERLFRAITWVLEGLAKSWFLEETGKESSVDASKDSTADRGKEPAKKSTGDIAKQPDAGNDKEPAVDPKRQEAYLDEVRAYITLLIRSSTAAENTDGCGQYTNNISDNMEKKNEEQNYNE